MKMHNFGKVALLAGAALALNSTNAQFIEIDDMVDIFLTGKIEGQYTTNVFNQSNGTVDDTVLIVVPGVEILIGDSAQYASKTTFQETIRRYSDTTGVNAEMANIQHSFTLRPSGAPRLSIRGGAGFAESQQNTPDVNVAANNRGRLIEREFITARIGAAYEVSQQWEVDAAFRFRNRSFVNDDSLVVGQRNIFSDSYQYSFPLNVLYKPFRSNDMKVGFGYEYRYTDVERNAGQIFARANQSNYEDHFFSLAFRDVKPKWVPKLTFRGNVGFQLREADSDRGEDSFNFASDIGVKYEVTPKLDMLLDYMREHKVGSNAQSLVSDKVAFVAIYKITPKIQTSGNISYEFADYENQDRTDGTTRLGLNASYFLNDVVSFTGGYNFVWNDNDGVVGTSYSNNTFSLAANIRY